jgi:hypothetical protein
MLPPSHRLSLASIPLVVSASLAGCRSNSPPAPAPAASATSSSRADLFASPDDLNLPSGFSEDSGAAGAGGSGGPAEEEPDHGLEIVLKDAGVEPRTPLTYDLAVGKPQTLVLNVTTTLKEEKGEKGNAEPSGGLGDMPPLRLTLSVVAGEKPVPDQTLFQAHVTKAEFAPGGGARVPPEAAAQMGELSKAFGAIGATFAVSKRGVIDDAHLSGDPETQAAASNLLPLIEEAFELFFAPMPEEAVGVGAQWTVASPAAPGAPRGAIEKTYVLKARTPTTAIVQEELHEETPEQPIGDPRAPQGSTIAVVSKEVSTLNVRLTGVASKASRDEDTVMTTRDWASSPPSVVVTRMKRSLRLEAR